MIKCDQCKKGELKNKFVEYNAREVCLGKFRALVCTNCNETIFKSKSIGTIEKAARAKGVWGSGTYSIKVRKHGRITLPKKLRDLGNLKPKDRLSIIRIGTGEYILRKKV